MHRSGQIRDQPRGMDGGSRGRLNEDRAQPHAIANELTDDTTLHARRGEVDVSDPALESPSTAFTTRQEAARRERGRQRAGKRVGMQMLTIVACVIVIALLVAAILTREWILLGLAVLMFIPFMILVTAPFWLATTTKTMQDEAVRSQRNDSADRAPPSSPPPA